MQVCNVVHLWFTSFSCSRAAFHFILYSFQLKLCENVSYVLCPVKVNKSKPIARIVGELCIAMALRQNFSNKETDKNLHVTLKGVISLFRSKTKCLLRKPAIASSRCPFRAGKGGNHLSRGIMVCFLLVYIGRYGKGRCRLECQTSLGKFLLSTDTTLSVLLIVSAEKGIGCPSPFCSLPRRRGFLRRVLPFSFFQA